MEFDLIESTTGWDLDDSSLMMETIIRLHTSTRDLSRILDDSKLVDKNVLFRLYLYTL